MPRELNEKNLHDQVVICTFLLQNENELFLNRIITGDKKWITYENIVRKRVYCEPEHLCLSTSKPSLNINKRIL